MSGSSRSGSSGGVADRLVGRGRRERPRRARSIRSGLASSSIACEPTSRLPDADEPAADRFAAPAPAAATGSGSLATAYRAWVRLMLVTRTPPSMPGDHPGPPGQPRPASDQEIGVGAAAEDQPGAAGQLDALARGRADPGRRPLIGSIAPPSGTRHTLAGSTIAGAIVTHRSVRTRDPRIQGRRGRRLGVLYVLRGATGTRRRIGGGGADGDRHRSLGRGHAGAAAPGIPGVTHHGRDRPAPHRPAPGRPPHRAATAPGRHRTRPPPHQAATAPGRHRTRPPPHQAATAPGRHRTRPPPHRPPPHQAATAPGRHRTRPPRYRPSPHQADTEAATAPGRHRAGAPHPRQPKVKE